MRTLSAIVMTPNRLTGFEIPTYTNPPLLVENPDSL